MSAITCFQAFLITMYLASLIPCIIIDSLLYQLSLLHQALLNGELFVSDSYYQTYKLLYRIKFTFYGISCFPLLHYF